jgi:tetratricopeptide (TPR) repeat protein
MLHRQGMLPEAAYEYGQAIAIKPDFAEAYAFRGQAWLTLGTESQALRDFDQALSYERQGFTKSTSENFAHIQDCHGPIPPRPGGDLRQPRL